MSASDQDRPSGRELLIRLLPLRHLGAGGPAGLQPLRRLAPSGILLALLTGVLLVDRFRAVGGHSMLSILMSMDPWSMGLWVVTVLLAAGLSWTLFHPVGATGLAPGRRGDAAGALASGADLQDVSRRMVEVQEAVRRQTSDYLHGHLQSKLVAISMSVNACQKNLRCDPVMVLSTLGRIQEELKRIQDIDLRRVSQELYPAIIKLGLVPATQSLVDRFKDVIDIELVISPEVESLDQAGGNGLPEKARLGVYRVTEEVLTNVFKHAQADRIKVCLAREGPEHLLVSVADNGHGFDPALVVGSQGLLGMADYAQAIGGHAQISSAPGQGTTVGLLVPVSWPKVLATEAPVTAAPPPA